MFLSQIKYVLYLYIQTKYVYLHWLIKPTNTKGYKNGCVTICHTTYIINYKYSTAILILQIFRLKYYPTNNF